MKQGQKPCFFTKKYKKLNRLTKIIIVYKKKVQKKIKICIQISQKYIDYFFVYEYIQDINRKSKNFLEKFTSFCSPLSGLPPFFH